MKKIIISGGGIGGLVAAKLLHKNGYDVTVIDKAKEFSNVGFLLGLKSFGMEIMQELGLLESLEAMASTNKSMNFIEPNGKRIRTISTEKTNQNGVKSLIITRGDLHKVIYDSVKNDIKFIFGTTVESVDQTENIAIVTLLNKEVIEADLLIVSEGLRSSTRDKYFDKISALEDFNIFYLGGRLSGTHKFEMGANLSFIGINKMLSIYPINKDELAIQCYIYNTDAVSKLQSNTKQLVKESFKDFDKDAEGLINEIANNGVLFSDKMGMVHSSNLSNGRIVLLGDAAYCPTALSGMGASLSIYGAKVLTHFITQTPENILLALKNYNDFMQPIIEKFQTNARKNATSFLPKNKFKHLIFKLFFKYVPESILLKKMTEQLVLTEEQMKFQNTSGH